MVRVLSKFSNYADLFDKDLAPQKRQDNTFDQSDESQIAEVGKKYGPFDIIIDDGVMILAHYKNIQYIV